LETYHSQTEPLIAFYKQRNKLKTVDNQPTIEATTAEIYKALGI
jgi:adenylate kinase